MVIENDLIQMEMVPELGAGVRTLRVRCAGRWLDLWRPTTVGGGSFNDLACYLLAPWTNRIARGAFVFNGERRVQPDWRDGTAIHGLVKTAAARIVDRSPLSARVAFDPPPGYPWPIAVQARHEVFGPEIRFSIRMQNLGADEAPVGCGWHPYFMRHLGDPGARAVVRAGVRARYPAVGCIPTGDAADDEVCRALRAGTDLPEFLDDVFTADGSASVEWPAEGVRCTFRVSSNLGRLVVYNPTDKPWFCVEACTMANDGFNLEARGIAAGVQRLKPGKHMEANWTMILEGLS